MRRDARGWAEKARSLAPAHVFSSCGQGCCAVSISTTVHPSDQISARRPYPFPLMTSGACVKRISSGERNDNSSHGGGSQGKKAILVTLEADF